MPQGPAILWKCFPNGDSDALELIAQNFIVYRGGVIRPRVSGYKPSYDESLALDHLFMEWDYTVEVADTHGSMKKALIEIRDKNPDDPDVESWKWLARWMKSIATKALEAPAVTLEVFASRSQEKRIRTMRGDKNPLDPRPAPDKECLDCIAGVDHTKHNYGE